MILAMSPSGWRARGYLPHLDSPEELQIITLHLFDALPRSVLEAIEEDVKSMPDSEAKKERRRLLEKYIDAGYGACWLRRPQIASLVEELLLAGHARLFDLFEWVIMPNHLHALVKPHDGISLTQIVRAWKGPSAVAANRLLGRSGPFWFREYHDRYMRNTAHLQNSIAYIHTNPVRAGLCATPQAWPFGSARFGDPDAP
jgi:REP element-mobilizing transposase RayT